MDIKLTDNCKKNLFRYTELNNLSIEELIEDFIKDLSGYNHKKSEEHIHNWYKEKYTHKPNLYWQVASWFDMDGFIEYMGAIKRKKEYIEWLKGKMDKSEDILSISKTVAYEIKELEELQKVYKVIKKEYENNGGTNFEVELKELIDKYNNLIDNTEKPQGIAEMMIDKGMTEDTVFYRGKCYKVKVEESQVPYEEYKEDKEDRAIYNTVISFDEEDNSFLQKYKKILPTDR